MAKSARRGRGGAAAARRAERGEVRLEQWESEGGQDAASRAHALWKRRLQEYVAPPLDPAIDEALQAFMRKRKDSMPDAFV